MAFSTQALKYGWVALATLGVLTGATIYVANNTRKTVRAEDIIEYALGVYERCLGTQYGTNAAGEPLYYVDPPSFVRTWYSNVYTNDGVTIYTNVVTNTIGWGLDRNMMVSLDGKIKSLVPCYLDTNNPPHNLTVTGLWASLGIGDGTNKFTRTPALGTNVATYGDYPWQIYEEDLVERYKVLNALEYITNSPACMISNDIVYVWHQAEAVAGISYSWVTNGGGEQMYGAWWPNNTISNFDDVKAYTENSYSNVVPPVVSGGPASLSRIYTLITSNAFSASLTAVRAALLIKGFNTNNAHYVKVEARSRQPTLGYHEWDSQGAFGAEDEWVTIIEATNSFESNYISGVYGSISIPKWNENIFFWWFGIGFWRGNSSEARYTAEYDGPSRWVTNYLNIYGLTNAFGTNWYLSYCTNKFW